MAIKLAYGRKEDIWKYIDNKIIPTDTLIITKSNLDSELLFYDNSKELVPISERIKFNTVLEAQKYIEKYNCTGNILSINENDTWTPYIVQNNSTLLSIIDDIDSKIDAKVENKVNEALEDIISKDDQSEIIIFNGKIDVSNIIGLEDKINEVIDNSSSSSDSVIEIIKINNNPLEVNLQDKSINIPIATFNELGVVKSSNKENFIKVHNDGELEINTLNVNKLSQNVNEDLILNCGNSN